MKNPYPDFPCIDIVLGKAVEYSSNANSETSENTV